ncbi:MAG: polyprenyl synthetase family protein [Candidatus Bathyarchaeia archaeon]
MAEWEKTLDEYGAIIEGRTSKFLDMNLREASTYHQYIGDLYRNIDEYIHRKGKRLASCSALLTYEGFHGRVDEGILDVCVGIELYRHCILVHDDLADDDEVRRGSVTLHRKYSQEHGLRFGVGAAVFTGNILYSLALKVIGDSGFKPEKTLRALRRLNRAFQEVNESQVLDLLFEHERPSLDEWYVMASKRAASLFKASLLIGAELADAPDKDIKLLEEAAEQIGYCFDIQDDIIDLFAPEHEYGRRPGGDLLRGKKPLHIVYTYRMATQQQIGLIEGTTLKGNLTNEDLDIIRRIVRECGALRMATERSMEHADSAKRLISKTGMRLDVKEFYSSFIDYIKGSLTWYK